MDGLITTFYGVINIEKCQTYCDENEDCEYFVKRSGYRYMEGSYCDLYTDSATTKNRNCTMVHGTAQPDFQECYDNGDIPWEKKGM